MMLEKPSKLPLVVRYLIKILALTPTVLTNCNHDPLKFLQSEAGMIPY